MLRTAKILICNLSFLLLCIGFQVDVHFSGSEMYSIAFFGQAESCCEGPCDCCHNEGVNITFKADYVLSEYEDVDSSFKTIDLYWHPIHMVQSRKQGLIKPQFLFPDSPPLIYWQTRPVDLQTFRC